MFLFILQVFLSKINLRNIKVNKTSILESDVKALRWDTKFDQGTKFVMQIGQNLKDRTLLNPLAAVTLREYLKIWNLLVRGLSQAISYAKPVMLWSGNITLGKN